MTPVARKTQTAAGAEYLHSDRIRFGAHCNYPGEIAAGNPELSYLSATRNPVKLSQDRLCR
jgi:hypothetical protein